MGGLMLRPDVRKVVQPGIDLVHIAKVGSDFASGHGKWHMMMKNSVEFDEDGSHNSAFQTLLISKDGEAIFKNDVRGGSAPLRLFCKTTEEDSQERMVAEMEQLDKLSKDIPPQVIFTK